jgi:DNA-binding NtrC family response regulator
MTVPTMRILVADDEAHLVDIQSRVLREEGYTVFSAAGGREACALAEQEQVHLVLVDLTMPGCSGLEVLAFIKERCPETRVVIMTAFATAETAVEAMKQGALDYLIKPFSLDELKLHVRRAAGELALARENRLLRREAAGRGAGSAMVGRHPALLAARELARKAADEPSTVLITGESGTGKELIARLLHDEARSRSGAFVAINCAAVPETLLERELFGHERGAFTGADAAGDGLLHAADGGTLFLDEIGDMSPAMQAKLLRVLEGHEYLRVGGTRPLKARVRFVAATNRDLAMDVRSGRFREDLYYRLNVVTIALPPLRERGDDVALLAAHFLADLARRRGRAGATMDDGALAALRAYAWPGNVRELRNVLERALLIMQGDAIATADLALAATAAAPEGARLNLPIAAARDAFEREYLAHALKLAEGNVSKTAERIGLDRRNLQIKIKKYGLKAET